MSKIEIFNQTEINIHYERDSCIDKLAYCILATDIGELFDLPDILDTIKIFNRDEVVTIKTAGLKLINDRCIKINLKYLTIHGIFRLFGHSKDPLHLAFLDWVCKVFL